MFHEAKCPYHVDVLSVFVFVVNETKFWEACLVILPCVFSLSFGVYFQITIIFRKFLDICLYRCSWGYEDLLSSYE